MTVTITLTISGSNTGPFDLHSDLDAFATPFETNVARNDLIAGYTTALVPDGTNTIRIISTGECTNYIDVTVIPYTTTTTTSTVAPTTTSTTTAPIGNFYYSTAVFDCSSCLYESTTEFYSMTAKTVGHYYGIGDGFAYLITGSIIGPGPIVDLTDYVDYGTDCASVPCTTTTTTTLAPTTTTTTTVAPTTTTTTTTP